ncbi:MAG: hypothetical protein ACRDUV_25720 [Pseudonocardiaceae bacterium]
MCYRVGERVEGDDLPAWCGEFRPGTDGSLGFGEIGPTLDSQRALELFNLALARAQAEQRLGG